MNVVDDMPDDYKPLLAKYEFPDDYETLLDKLRAVRQRHVQEEAKLFKIKPWEDSPCVPWWRSNPKCVRLREQILKRDPRHYDELYAHELAVWFHPNRSPESQWPGV
jgi:hypothetical protein